jgi:hypothetical protein
MLQKTTGLVMAAIALAAIVLPASAPAFWKHGDTNPIQQDKQFGVTGSLLFETNLNGQQTMIGCLITSKIKLTADQTTGLVETFTPEPGEKGEPRTDTERCSGSGWLAFCQVHNLSPQAPNWLFHIGTWQTTQLSGDQTKALGDDKVAAVLTTQDVTVQLTGGFCPAISKITITKGSVGLIPDQNPTIKQFQLDGILQAHYQTATGQDTQHVEVGGFWNFEGTASGTYSI